MIIALLTDIPGSSSMVDRGFVTYSNEAKIEMLGVSAATLEASWRGVARNRLEMAAGALAHSRAGIALAVTGIAGPDGGSPEKPVGLVWFGLALTGQPVARREAACSRIRGRDFIRRETVRTCAGRWGWRRWTTKRVSRPAGHKSRRRASRTHR